MKTMSKVFLAVLFGFIAWLILQIIQFEYTVPTLEEFVRGHGYPLESHEVVTEDGYILTLHRIPHGKGQKNGRRHPVLLHHGSTGTAYNFLGLGPNSSLGFLLADKGYDVWIANSRGVKYSMKHVSYNTTDSEYWNFSWHEIGVYDLPAVIDYILNSTKREKLPYIGHSMGGTVLAVLLTSKPEYNQKIEVFLGFVPALYFEKTDCAFMNFFSRYYAPFLMNIFGHGSWNPWSEGTAEFLYKNCRPERFLRHFCLTLYNALGHSTEVRMEDLPAIFSTLFSTFSLKALIHFGQQVDFGKFQHYNYDPSENMRRYGTIEPPEYDFKMMTVPTVLFYSDGDNAVLSEGMIKVSKKLPNATTYKVPIETFNHLDFLYGKNAVDVLYKEVYRILHERTSKI